IFGSPIKFYKNNDLKYLLDEAAVKQNLFYPYIKQLQKLNYKLVIGDETPVMDILTQNNSFS
ncbi:MAG: hypothetical protein KJ583_05385, partial [Nanoarchaeota archaeon]|nr:hypothetical protein [Nanoarchaeota archaeon]MBU1604723.1 hypothetical protein [Nanoarchaeota archaeon]MBU2442975.1 hypothetical protein [Nanoarchaeota archaeon]